MEFQTNDYGRRSCYSAEDDSPRLPRSRENKTKTNYYRRFAHFFKLFELPKEKSTIASTLKYGHNITTRTINKFFRQRKSCRHRLTAYPTRASRTLVPGLFTRQPNQLLFLSKYQRFGNHCAAVCDDD